MDALLINKVYLDKIFAGAKRWEIRGSATHKRGRIGLVESGTGTVVGTCDLASVRGPLSIAELKANARLIGAQPNDYPPKPYARTFAWVLERPKRFKRAVPYEHPQGAVIWVKLDKRVVEAMK